MSACNCMGPQNGEPFCPCMMRQHDRWQQDSNLFNKFGHDHWQPAPKVFKTFGLEPIPRKDFCSHPEHEPPMHIYVPHGQQYRHVCPGCNKEIIIQNDGTTL